MSLIPLLISMQGIAIPPFTRGVAIGDSTVDAYLGQNSVPSYVYTAPELSAGNEILNISEPAETIDQQLARWNAIADPTIYTWVICQIGLNDVSPTTPVATIMADYQNMIDQIRADAPDIFIIVATMTPAKSRWPDVFPGQEVAAQTCWEDMNDAMMGIGPNAVTGVDYRFDGHTEALSDEDGNLDAAYDTGDGIHENNAGRQIIGETHWRGALINNHFLAD